MRGGMSQIYGPASRTVQGQNVAVPASSGDIRSGATQVAPIPVTSVFSGLRGSILGAPLTWLFGLIGVLIAYKLIEEHRGGREAFAEVKIGLNNVVKIGIAAVVFMLIFKFLFLRYDVPGLSEVAKAV